ncbi:MAG: NYN domain-containing protein [Candidatus Ratteibacteria bacterium]|nr:NYN domain-containing protein [Candidatus Ratteibacteria bacterium]
MEYIIDGYNLIKSGLLSGYEGRGLDYSIRMLIGILIDYRRRHPSISFVVVFDGNPPYPYIFPQEKGIKVVFSGDISADEVIRIRVEKTPEKNISKTVVSNDREVKDAGHLFGARVMGVSEFLEIVCPSKKGNGKKEAKKEVKKKVSSLNIIEKELKKHYKI